MIDVAAVLFDCDGVLVDSAASVERAWRRWATERGLDEDAVVAIAHGRRTEDTLIDLGFSDDLAAEVERLEGAEVADAASVSAFPEAAALLPSLPPEAWAVVTSGTHALVTSRLAAAGLPLPSVLVTAEDVAAGKPDPEGYLEAARRLGRLPADCLVIEDAPGRRGGGDCRGHARRRAADDASGRRAGGGDTRRRLGGHRRERQRQADRARAALDSPAARLRRL